MPKEVTHFMIIDAVSTQLKRDPFWYSLKEFKNELYLGSIFPDVFYFFKEKKRGELTLFPDFLHGSQGEDTLMIVKNTLKDIKHFDPHDKHHMQKVAFLIGVVSHIFADSLFHPFVYYHTGHYYSDDETIRVKAIKEHRRIESLMDILFAQNRKKIRSYQISNMLNTSHHLLHLFDQVLKNMFKTYHHTYPLKLMDSYKRFHRIRKIYTCPIFQPILSFLDRYGSNKTKMITSLGYPNNLKNYTFSLTKKIGYQNPLTGETQEHSLQELMDLVINETYQYCQGIKEFLLYKNHKIFNQIGCSLETNTLNSYAKEMKYFSKRCFFD